MASAKFLEEALSTDVDESVVSAIVGSLENQLVTSAPHASSSSIVLNHNHINSGISNGGTVVRQKHSTTGSEESIEVVSTDANEQVINNAMQISGTQVQAVGGAVTTNYIHQQNPSSIEAANKCNEGVRVVYSQGNQTISSSGTIMTNRVAVSGQSLPNGTIGISPHQVLQTSSANIQTIQNKQQPTLVIKTSGAPVGTPGLVTVPMNVTTSVPPANNVGSPSTQSPNVLSNLQVVNVRPGVSTAQKGQPARVVLGTPQIVGHRPGTPVSGRLNR